MKHTIILEYFPKCNWLLRAAYFAQEFLASFEENLEIVSLKPSEINGAFIMYVDDVKIFDRKEYGGFPEIKVLKQFVRDIVAPEINLGHADTPSHLKTSK
ncbi:MAG: SelT/SelW/SelH family protein [Saprospiraceae bacterium]